MKLLKNLHSFLDPFSRITSFELKNDPFPWAGNQAKVSFAECRDIVMIAKAHLELDLEECEGQQERLLQVNQQQKDN